MPKLSGGAGVIGSKSMGHLQRGETTPFTEWPFGVDFMRVSMAVTDKIEAHGGQFSAR